MREPKVVRAALGICAPIEDITRIQVLGSFAAAMA